MSTSNLKKRYLPLFSFLAIFSLVGQPILALAQTSFGLDSTSQSQSLLRQSGEIGGWTPVSESSYQSSFNLNLSDADDLYYAPFDNSSSPFNTNDGSNPFSPTRNLEQREQKDENSDKSEAQRLKEQQKKDLEECIKQNGMSPGFSAFGSASDILEGGVNRIFDDMSERIKDDIRGEVEGLIKGGLKDELEDTVKTSIKELLKQRLQAELPRILGQVIQNRLNNGQEVTPEYLNLVLPQEINSVIANNLPSITNQALRAGIPAAIGNLLEDNLPTIISQSVRGQFSSTMSNMPSLLQGALGDNLDSFMRNQISQSTTNTIVTEAQFGGVNQLIMTQLTTTMTSQMGGSMDSIINELTRNISSSIEIDSSELDSITDSIADEISGQFSDLADQMSDYMTGQLDSSLDQVVDQLSSSLDQIIDPITNSLDDMVNQVIDPITESLDNMINSTVEQLTGSLTSVLDSVTTSLTNQIQDITNNIVESVTEPITEAISGVTDSLVENITEPITNAIDNVTSQLTSPLTEAVGNMIPGLDDVTGLISLRVPTSAKEEPGSHLSQTTDKIKEENVEMKKNLIQICMHAKATKRIQQNFEKKEFVEDPKAEREARTKNEEYRQQLDQLLKEGFEARKGEFEPLVPTNINSHIKLYVDEATKIYLGNLANSGNRNQRDLASQLYYQYNKGPMSDLKSTLTQADKQTLDKPDPSKGKEYWEAWLKVLEPQNNYNGSLLLAQQQLSGAQTLAEKNAREELLAGEGFRGIRECKGEMINGECKEWVTITPGSVVKDTLSESMQYRQEQYTLADEYGDVVPGNEPSSQELRTFTPSTQGGGGGRGSLASFGLDMIFNLAEQFLGNGGLGNIFGNNNSSTSPQTSTTAPTVTFSFTSPAWIEIMNGTSSNSAILKWVSTNADKCVADNTWYSKQDSSSNKIVKNEGDNLGIQGSQVVDFPLNNPLVITRVRGGASFEIKKTLGPNADLTSRVATFEIKNEDYQSGDTVNVSSGNLSVSVPVNSTGTSTVISAIRTKLQSLNISSPEYKEFGRYSFTYNLYEGKISASLIPFYKIKCLKGNKEISKSVNVTR